MEEENEFIEFDDAVDFSGEEEEDEKEDEEEV